MTTKIEWCDEVWNTTTGCTKISDGCDNCYAERMANRFWKNQEVPTGYVSHVYDPVCPPMEVELRRPRKFSDVLCHPERLDIPLRWKKPRKIFVDSMSDLFHPLVPDNFIRDVFDVMSIEARHHTYMILTKRQKRMMEFMNGSHEYVQSHVWLGVSVEDQENADRRIPILLETSAALRFVSVEPMLGYVDIRKYLPNLDWVICGCESGANARPMDMGWARWLKTQCLVHDIPFFFKQAKEYGVLDKMPVLDGEVWDQYPISERVLK